MQSSDVVITGVMVTNSGLLVQFYIQGTRGGVIPQQAIASAVKVINNGLINIFICCELLVTGPINEPIYHSLICNSYTNITTLLVIAHSTSALYG